MLMLVRHEIEEPLLYCLTRKVIHLSHVCCSTIAHDEYEDELGPRGVLPVILLEVLQHRRKEIRQHLIIWSD